MKKKSVVTLTMCLAVSAVSLTFAKSNQQQVTPFVGQVSTMSIPATTTSSYLAPLGVIKTAQVSFPNVYVWPAFAEKWFSTVRICNTVGNLFAGDQQIPVKMEVFDGGGGILNTIPLVTLLPNTCETYTSDVAGDPLFTGLAPGVYSVTATVIAQNSGDLVTILTAGGNLNGSVNSTASNFIKPMVK